MAYRVLGAAHLLVALPLLLLAAMSGILAPLVALGPVWLIFIGVQLWRGPSLQRYRLVRTTHRAGLAVAALLCYYGIFALRAAERSAAAGGGLLGAFGLFPLGIGIALAVLSIASLTMIRRPAPRA